MNYEVLTIDEKWVNGEVAHYKHFILLTEDKKPIGRGVLYWFEDKDGNLNNAVMRELYVQPEFRGQGYAKILQELREEYTRDVLNLAYIWLWVNEKSWMVDWYKRRGYEFEVDVDDINEAADVDLYPDDRWMQKEL